MIKKAPKKPPIPLSTLMVSYITDNRPLSDIAKEYNITINRLKAIANDNAWPQIRKAYRQVVSERALTRAVDVKIAQIERVQAAELDHLTEAINQLEVCRRALRPQEWELDDKGKRRPVHDEPLSLKALQTYAEARARLQAMIYRTLGIAEARHDGGSNTTMIFNHYPQGSDIVRRYAATDEQDPPRQANHPPYSTDNLTPSAVNAAKIENASTSLAEYRYDDEGESGSEITDISGSEWNRDGEEHLPPMGSEYTEEEGNESDGMDVCGTVDAGSGGDSVGDEEGEALDDGLEEGAVPGAAVEESPVAPVGPSCGPEERSGIPSSYQESFEEGEPDQR